MNDRNRVYRAFLDYYGDLQLKLNKRQDNYVIYACRVHSALNDYRYIFVVVHDDGFRAPVQQLSQLAWESFQTRTSSDFYGDVPLTDMVIPADRLQYVEHKLTILSRTRDKSEYTTHDLPINVVLLHDRRKNNSLQYPDEAKLYQALGTYQCVVTLL